MNKRSEYKKVCGNALKDTLTECLICHCYSTVWLYIISKRGTVLRKKMIDDNNRVKLVGATSGVEIRQDWFQRATDWTGGIGLTSTVQYQLYHS